MIYKTTHTQTILWIVKIIIKILFLVSLFIFFISQKKKKSYKNNKKYTILFKYKGVRERPFLEEQCEKLQLSNMLYNNHKSWVYTKKKREP